MRLSEKGINKLFQILHRSYHFTPYKAENDIFVSRIKTEVRAVVEPERALFYKRILFNK